MDKESIKIGNDWIDVLIETDKLLIFNLLK